MLKTLAGQGGAAPNPSVTFNNIPGAAPVPSELPPPITGYDPSLRFVGTVPTPAQGIPQDAHPITGTSNASFAGTVPSPALGVANQSASRGQQNPGLLDLLRQRFGGRY